MSLLEHGIRLDISIMVASSSQQQWPDRQSPQGYRQTNCQMSKVSGQSDRGLAQSPQNRARAGSEGHHLGRGRSVGFTRGRNAGLGSAGAWISTVAEVPTSALEGVPVVVRRGRENAMEVHPQVRTGAQADLVGDLLDEIGRASCRERV